MRIPTRCLASSAAVFAASLSVSGSALASDLKVNGGAPAVSAPYSGGLAFELKGGAAKPALIFADATPGPTFVLGEPVPLGLTGALMFVASGQTSAGGSFTAGKPIPDDPDLAGVQLFVAGVILDPADPNGLDVSNGVAVTIVPPVGAGVDQTAFTGQTAVLDGSGALGAASEPPPGMTFQWTLLAKPGGSTASLQLATSPFALLTPDQPGDYSLRLRVGLGGVIAEDQSVLHAYRLVLTPEVEGTYSPFGGAFLSGTLSGPAGAALKLNGTPVPLAGGAFASVLASFDLTQKLQDLLFEVQHADGSQARLRKTMGSGISVALATSSPDALVARLGAAGLDALQPAAAAELAQADVAALLLSQPPVQISNETGPFGFTIFSATVDFTGITYAPNMAVDLWPAADGVHGKVSIFNVKANFDVWGEVLEIGYDLSGNITSSPVDISATLKVTASGGALHAAVSNVSVVRNNFDFNLNGFIGDVAELFVIESYVKDEVEAAVASAVASELGPGIEAILSGLEPSGSLFSALDVDALVAASFSGVTHDANGVTLRLAGSASVGAAEPGSPLVTQVLWNPSAPPVFGATTPLGAGYGAALAIADDFVNQVLAAATGAGLLDGDLSSLIAGGTGGGGVALTTDALDPLFPGAGFDYFPDGTPVELRAHGTLPPILRTAPFGPDMALLEIGGLRVTFRIASPYGTLPWMTLVLDGTAGMDLTAQPDGTLAATLGTANVQATVLSAIGGANTTVLQTGLDLLTGLLLPELTQALGAIPLPSLEAQGLAIVPSELGLAGGSLEYAAFWGQLALSPP